MASKAYALVNSDGSITAETGFNVPGSFFVVDDTGALVAQSVETKSLFVTGGFETSFSGPSISQPFTDYASASTFLSISPNSGTDGGTLIRSLINGDSVAMSINAYIGSGGPVSPVITLNSAKTNGGSGATALNDSEIALQVQNNFDPIVEFWGNFTSKFYGRVLEAQGADVASANDLNLGKDGNTFEITGATQINAIATAFWQNGARITLLFTSNPTVKNNTAGGAGTAVILLAGSVDFSATAGDTLSLVLSEIGGVQAWREVSRAVI